MSTFFKVQRLGVGEVSRLRALNALFGEVFGDLDTYGARPPEDAWLEALSIPMAYRHRAIVDCLATAQLLVAVLHEAPRLGAPTAKALLSLSQGERWLG